MVPFSLPPLANEDQFEELCLAVLQRHWSKPQLERYGRRGQKQHGVDLLDISGSEPLHAAQCKLSDISRSLSLTLVQEEVEKAKRFPLKIGVYAILTTAKPSTQLQQLVLETNRQHKLDGAFNVELYEWERIAALINQYPDIRARFYGGVDAFTATKIESQVQAIFDLVVTTNAQIGPGDLVESEIDEARDQITQRNFTLAILLLTRLRNRHLVGLSARQLFRILTNLGAASLALGRSEAAADYFREALQQDPHNEVAIVNGLLADNLTCSDRETHAAAEKLRALFPNNTRVLAIWIATAPEQTRVAELLPAVTQAAIRDPEVFLALCRRSLIENSFGSAIEFAREAVSTKQDWLQAHFALAESLLAAATSISTQEEKFSREKLLVECESAAKEAVRLAREENNAHVEARSYHFLSQTANLRGRYEEAATFADQSKAASPREPFGMLARSQTYFLQGKTQEGMRELETLLSLGNPPQPVVLMYARALLSLGGAEHAKKATAHLCLFGHLFQTHRNVYVALLVEASCLAEEHESAARIIEEQREFISLALYTTLKGRLAAATGKPRPEVEVLCLQANEQLVEGDDAATKKLVAQSLLENGHQQFALAILYKLFASGYIDIDVVQLINLAAGVERDDLVLSICQSLRADGQLSWQFVEFECQYLERYDLNKALSLLEDFLEAHPGHQMAQLRLMGDLMRLGRAIPEKYGIDSLPDPESLPARYALPAVQVIQALDQPEAAVDYSYRHLRKNFLEVQAHQAFAYSLLPESKPLSIPVSMESVEIGSAVLYQEGASPPQWLVIERTERPEHCFEEVSATSSVALDLIGKRCGEEFTLAQGAVKDRKAIIQAILSKYTRRFQDCMAEMQVRFGSAANVESIQMGSGEELTEEDIEPILRSIRARADAHNKMQEFYHSGPLTLHMYGEKLGRNAYFALLDLAHTAKSRVKTAESDMGALPRATKLLLSKRRLVLDLSVFATLHLLNLFEAVASIGRYELAITQATLLELRGMAKLEFNGVPRASLAFRDGQNYMFEETAENSINNRNTFQAMLTAVTERFVVLPGLGVAELNADKRDIYDRVIGRGGLESVIASTTSGTALWTDDLVFATFATAEFGCDRVWSQAVLESLAQQGHLSVEDVRTASARLLAFGYEATQYNSGVILAAFRLAQGSLNTFPVPQVLHEFSSGVAKDFEVSARIFGETLFLIYREAFLPETSCALVHRLLDCFEDGAKSRIALKAVVKQVASLMVLMPTAQRNLLTCFQRWEKSKAPLLII